jgi:glycosyltransferase involved in cell wall biosynthesis
MEFLIAILSIIGIIGTIYIHQKRWSLFRKAIFKYHQGVSNNPTTPISVIICSQNPESRFVEYLKCVLEQNYSYFEVIVLISKPIEKVEIELNSISPSARHLRIIALDESCPYTEKKQALNQAIKDSKHEWIVTIDDDCYPESENWLSSIAKKIEQENCDIVLGISPFISQSGFLQKFIRFDWLRTNLDLLSSWSVDRPIFGVGRNMAFKKNLWSEEYLNKYQEHGAGDDTCLVQFYRESKKISLMCESQVFTFPKLTFYEWILQKNRHYKTGFQLTIQDKKYLAQTPIFLFLFFTSIWVWISWLPHPFVPILLYLFYSIYRINQLFQVEKFLSVRRKTCWFLPIIEPLHLIYQLLTPILFLILPKRWK